MQTYKLQTFHPCGCSLWILEVLIICLVVVVSQSSDGDCPAHEAQCRAQPSNANATPLMQAASSLGCGGRVPEGQQERAYMMDCVSERLFPKSGQVHAGSGKSELGSTYGEVTLAGGRILASEIGREYGYALGTNDVFLDAGSGVGKLPAQFFLEHQVARAFGIEMHPNRCISARRAAEALASAFHSSLTNVSRHDSLDDTTSALLNLGKRQLGFLCGDMLSFAHGPVGPLHLQDVSVLLTNSLCFPTDVMVTFQEMVAQNLFPGTLVFSSKELSGCNRGLIDLGLMRLKHSRSIPSLFNVYIVAPPVGIPVEVLSNGELENLKNMMQALSQKKGIAHVIQDGMAARLLNVFQSVSAETQNSFVTHHATGREGSANLCILSDLALHLDFTNASTALSKVMNDRPVYGSTLKPENSLFHMAVGLRSRTLLSALSLGNASPGPHAPSVDGKLLCHRELDIPAVKQGWGLSMVSLLKNLDGKGSTLAPPGSLLPFLVNELGVSCISPDANGRLPLHDAAISGDNASMLFLLNASQRLPSRGASHADNEGNTPLHLCEDVDVMLPLLRARADTSAQDGQTRTALHVHAERLVMLSSKASQASEQVRLLVEHHADVNAALKTGRTPLHEAAKHGIYADNALLLAELLLELRADVHAQDLVGLSPLHMAQNARMADLLLRNKAEVNQRDPKQQTPLHHATARPKNSKRQDIVQTLLHARADPELQDFRGRRPDTR